MTGIGVIGCGQWGKHYVRVFNELPGAEVVEVADGVRANLSQVRTLHPLVNVTTDHAALLDNPGVDAVVIATQAASHGDIAREAIARGKHVIVEKPLALRPEECAGLTEQARAAGLVLMVGHTFLFNDSIRKIKEILADPKSGRVYYLAARRNHLGKIREDVNVLWDLSAHDVSIFLYLLGREPTSVSAVGGCYLRGDREDVTFMNLFYPDGTIGHVEASWIDASKVRDMVVVTDKRRIEFNDLDNLESVRVFEKGITAERGVASFGEFQYLRRDGDIVSPKIERREPLRNLCRHFLECVNEGRAPLSDGDLGRKVVEVLAAASESLARRGKEIAI